MFNPAPMTPGIVNEFPMDKVAILIVNEHEAEDLYRDLGGQSKDKGGLDLAAELLKRFPNMQGVVVTLGGEGVIGKFRQEGDRIRDFIIPCQKVDVKDTTGAGDTFVVSVSLSLFVHICGLLSYICDRKKKMVTMILITFSFHIRDISWQHLSVQRTKTTSQEYNTLWRKLMSLHQLLYNV